MEKTNVSKKMEELINSVLTLSKQKNIKGKFYRGTQRVSASVLAVLSVPIVHSSAKELTQKDITVKQGIDIYYNDLYFLPKDKKGSFVEAFIYNGTTYVPARSLSELFGYPINWNGQDNSVHIDLTGSVDTYDTYVFSANQDKKPYMKDISVKTGVTLYVKDENGEQQVIPKDINGNEVPIIFYNGTNFLPVRAISNIFGQEVNWNSSFEGVTIGKYNDHAGQVQIEEIETVQKPSDFMEMFKEFDRMIQYILSYNDIIKARKSEINNIIVSSGYRLDRMQLDMSDKATDEYYYEEYWGAMREIDWLYRELNKYDIASGYEFMKQTMYVRIENGTYTEYDVIAVEIDYDLYADKVNTLPDILEKSTPDKIAAYRKRMEDVLTKIEDAIKTNKIKVLK